MGSLCQREAKEMMDELLKRMKIKGHKDARHPDYKELERLIKRLMELEKLGREHKKEEDRTKDRLAISQMLAAPRFQK